LQTGISAGFGRPSQAAIWLIEQENDMPGDYSNLLITIGSLACVAALGWFFESAREISDSNDDTLPRSEDTVQRRRAGIYMTAVILTMGATVFSVLFTVLA
jgi:hypothetical protein